MTDSRGGRGDYWKDRPRQVLKAEMERRGFSYRELAERMRLPTDRKSVQALTNKINRPNAFSAAFFMEALAAMGCRSLPVE